MKRYNERYSEHSECPSLGKKEGENIERTRKNQINAIFRKSQEGNSFTDSYGDTSKTWKKKYMHVIIHR